MAKPKLGSGQRFSALSSALNALSARARGRKSHGRHVKQQANLIAKTGQGPATPGSSTFGSRTGGS